MFILNTEAQLEVDRDGYCQNPNQTSVHNSFNLKEAHNSVFVIVGDFPSLFPEETLFHMPKHFHTVSQNKMCVNSQILFVKV